MTRKTKKGIIGKARITAKKRPDIGPGVPPTSFEACVATGALALN